MSDDHDAARMVRQSLRETWRRHPRLSLAGIVGVPLAIAAVVALLTTATSAGATGARGTPAPTRTSSPVPAATVASSVANGATGDVLSSRRGDLRAVIAS